MEALRKDGLGFWEFVREPSGTERKDLHFRTRKWLIGNRLCHHPEAIIEKYMSVSVGI